MGERMKAVRLGTPKTRVFGNRTGFCSFEPKSSLTRELKSHFEALIRY